MFRKTLLAVVLAAVLNCPFAQAGYTLIDIFANPGGWNTLTGGLATNGSADFASLPDLGATGINGPLTSAGFGPIPADFIPANITITTDLVAGGTQPLLVGIGPSAGLGNPVNALLVNDSFDAMVIDFADSVLAFEFTYVSAFGSGPITMEVTNDSGATTFYTGLNAPIAGGNRYGILGTGGDMIKSIRLHDLGVGFEGITDSFVSYQAVPEPSALLLLTAGLAACSLRRRRH